MKASRSTNLNPYQWVNLPPWMRQYIMTLFPPSPFVNLSPSASPASVSSDYGATERELVPGALRGYRSWRNGHDGNLLAVNFKNYWVRGVNVATCLAGGGACPGPLSCNMCAGGSGHVSPMADCTCGFYAAHQIGGVDHRGSVVGSIKAYGKVLVGPKGFKAQKAEIEALVFGGTVFTRTVMSEMWGVPIFSSTSELLEAFPPIPVDHLIPSEEEAYQTELQRRTQREAAFIAETARRIQIRARLQEDLAGMDKDLQELLKDQEKIAKIWNWEWEK